eukprot:8718089-Ditylum_brightwellii.AAC.1
MSNFFAHFYHDEAALFNSHLLYCVEQTKVIMRNNSDAQCRNIVTHNRNAQGNSHRGTYHYYHAA